MILSCYKTSKDFCLKTLSDSYMDLTNGLTTVKRHTEDFPKESVNNGIYQKYYRVLQTNTELQDVTPNIQG